MGYGMMNLEEKLSNDQRSSKNIEMMKKCCTDCKTTKTPLWRGGPAGPKSLCNACGIRYRKKSRASSAAAATTTTTISSADCSSENGLSESLKMRLMDMGKKIMFKRSTIVKKQRCQRRRRLLREEEQAAFSLMALSCGSVFA